MNLRGEQVIVLGLGQTGASCVRWLHAQGARVRVLDTRNTPPELSSVTQYGSSVHVYTGPYREEYLRDAKLIVASPGVDLREPPLAKQRASGVPILGDIELFAQVLNAQPRAPRVIAITGSNGKTTVTSMVGAMCAAAGLSTVVAGNIGVSVLDALTSEQHATAEIYVLELSSFQLETTSSLRLDSATLLNVTQDHLDRYDSMDDYAAAKARIFAHCKRRVLNREDGYSIAHARAEDFTFGSDIPRGENAWGLLREGDVTWLAQGGAVEPQRLLRVSELRVAGLHNAVNALAALALCRALDLPYLPLLQALREFKGLAHRVEEVARINGVIFYDDSKGTNVGATVAALNGMSTPVVLIAGGDGKAQDFSPLKAAVDAHARAVVLIGRDAPQIEAALQDSPVARFHAADLPLAVQQAYALAQPGEAVLLSPACASFDMFRNYAHRAKVFVSAVRELQRRESGVQ